MVDARPLRVVFFGTPAFAVPTLDALLSSRHAVVSVVTQPDRPRGRGQKTTDSPVKARAMADAVPLLQPASLKDPAFVSALESTRADLGVVAAYGRILPERVLATPRLGMINVHASLLPRYRGAAPVHRAVIAGELQTGVSIMRIVRALDAGPVLATAAHPIAADATSADIERDLARIGAVLLAATVDRLAAGEVEAIPQDEGAATYAHRLTKGDGLVDWSQPAHAVHNLIRGLHPWPHAYTFFKGRRLILLRSAPSPDQSGQAPGTARTAHGDVLQIAAGSGTVGLLELQTEGGRPMGPREFLAGHPIVPGDRFTSQP